MPTQNKNKRYFFFYIISIILSFLIALIALEAVLRSISLSSGIGVGEAHQRWMIENWRPINELGLRDLEITSRLPMPHPRIYFLGDSFTAGHGVRFQETFYFQTAIQMETQYNSFNIAKNGASTRDEIMMLSSFNELTQGHAEIVVHQYFPNDIEDYISRDAMPQPSGWQRFLATHLATAEFLLAYRANKDWSARYKEQLIAAYQNPDILSAHFNDLTLLHQNIRNQGGRVFFVFIPPLYPNESLDSSSSLKKTLRDFFARTCTNDDLFIDVSVKAQLLSENERIVNFMDPHPSPALHDLISQTLITALSEKPDSFHDRAIRSIAHCEALKLALSGATAPIESAPFR